MAKKKKKEIKEDPAAELIPNEWRDKIEEEMLRESYMDPWYNRVSVNDKPDTLVTRTSQPASSVSFNTYATSTAPGTYPWKGATRDTFMGKPIPPSWKYDPMRQAFEHQSGILLTEDEVVRRGEFPTEEQVTNLNRRMWRDKASRRRAGVETRGKLTLEITEDPAMLKDLMEDLADLADRDGMVTLTIQGYGIDVRILGSEYKEDTRERTAE